MSYPRFFVDFESVNGGTIILGGESARHISRSLRMTVGERIVVCDSEKNEHLCVIRSFSSDQVTVEVESVSKSEAEPCYEAVVYQACPKGDKMDSIVQKAVELGAYGIVAFLSDRCVARYDAAGFEKKCQRWQKIALEAAKQCGRGQVPYVRWLPDLKSVVEEIASSGSGFMCYEDESAVTLKEYEAQNADKKSIGFIVGSEGGFSLNEVEIAREAGMEICGLGKRILRCETAPAFALACLTYKFEL